MLVLGSLGLELKGNCKVVIIVLVKVVFPKWLYIFLTIWTDVRQTKFICFFGYMNIMSHIVCDS